MYINLIICFRHDIVQHFNLLNSVRYKNVEIYILYLKLTDLGNKFQ